MSISSTKIRKALLSAKCLQSPQIIWGIITPLQGRVIEGQQIGRTLGFPTANLEVVDDSKLIPKDGVYAVHVEAQRAAFKGDDEHWR